MPDVRQRVYEVARTIPPGETMTYGEIAKALGEEPMRARDVGAGARAEPVRADRAVPSRGRGRTASSAATRRRAASSTKRRLLEIEGAAIVAPPPVTQAGLFDGLIDA